MAKACADILLVIPAYREHLRLPTFLGQLVAQLKSLPFSIDILIVDDGSPESERQKLLQSINAETYGSCRIIEPLILEKNQGKGGAILKGWRSGIHARWFAFVDADGAVPASEVARLCSLACQKDRDEISLFATRVQMLGRRICRRRSRHVSGRIFATLVNLVFRAGVYDTQCGLKIIPATSFHRINSLLQGAGLCFDIELMLALRHIEAAIHEIPIDWEDKAGGKVRVWQHGLGMVCQLMRLRLRRRLG